MKSNSCLLSIELYELTGEQIGELREKHYSNKHAYKYLPDYCLTKENKISYTDSYLQFVNSGDDKFYLFNVKYAEQPLDEELSAVGLDYTFKNFDFSFLKKFTSNKYDDMYRCLPIACHLVIGIKYVDSGSYEYPEVEAEFSLIGYLNSNKELVKFHVQENV